MTQCTINTGQFYTQSPPIWHSGHFSCTLHLLSTLKKRDNFTRTGYSNEFT